MKFYIYACLMICNLNLFSQNLYNIKVQGTKSQDKYTISKTYTIIDNKDIVNNSFFVKTNNFIELDEITEIVDSILKINNINDFKIQKIERPFAFYYNNDLLSHKNLNKLVKIVFKSETKSFKIAEILNKSGYFQYTVPDYYVHLHRINSNDTLNNLQNYLEFLDVNNVWDIVKGDSTIIIGVVDSGFWTTHPDLINSIFINKNEIPNDNIDNDNNGFIDDIMGWDFVGNLNFEDSYYENYLPDNNVIPNNAKNSHGTHVAGIASAITNNIEGVSSLGYNLKCLPIKICPDTIDNLFRLSKGLEGILYASKMGANVINCSWSLYTNSIIFQEVIDEVIHNGSTVVIAAGNFMTDVIKTQFLTLQNLNNVISVGSNSILDTIKPSFFSNYGWNVDVFAPGESIFSTITENKYSTKSGTSMSAPVVASLVGLLQKIHPQWNNKQMELHLKANVDKFENFKNDTSRYWGVINTVNTLKRNYFSGLTNPGLTVENLLMEGNDHLDSLNKLRNFELQIKNYLANATNIKIEIIPLSDYFVMNENYYSVNQIKSDSTYKLKFEAFLSEKCPFYEGNIEILVKIEADNYKNLEYIQIPFQIVTSSKSTFVTDSEILPKIINNNIKSPSKNELFLIGIDPLNYSKGLMYSFGQIQPLTFFESIPTAFYPFSSDKIFISLNNPNKGNIDELFLLQNYKISQEPIKQPFNQISDIHFFDKQNGIIIGNSISPYLGIGTSNDSGKTWNTNPKIMMKDNEYIVHSNYNNDSSVVILTNANTMFISHNYGINWTETNLNIDTSNISNIIVNDLGTIIIIRQFYNSVDIYYSLDNGTTFNYNTFKLENNLINFFSANKTKDIYLVTSNNEVLLSKDYGKTLENISTKEFKSIYSKSSTQWIDDCGIRIWNYGNYLVYNDILNLSIDGPNKLEIAGKQNIKFDTINLKENKKEILFLENTGVKLSEISKIELTNHSQNFNLNKHFKNNILPCELVDSEIEFIGNQKGISTDTLRVYNNSENSILEYYLSGFVYDPTSINIQEDNSITIYPNPSYDYVKINFNQSMSKFIDVEIYSITGQLVETFENYKLNEKINLEKLYNGFYFIKVKTQKDIFMFKISIIK